MAEFFALSIIILLFSVILHEVMHGLAAQYFGDRTAERAGRLTLNPLPHIDPIGTVILPLVLIASGTSLVFGWAKPVPVNPLNFRSLKAGQLWVSAAGILTNFGLAVVAAMIFHLSSWLLPTPLVRALLFRAVELNLLLGIFNLLPIPPLDGSKIALALLPPHLAWQYQKLERYGFLILILLFFLPPGKEVIWQTIGLLVNLLSRLMGI